MGRKLKILFIAKNLPWSENANNPIIYEIADKLSGFCDISFLRPREFVPLLLKFIKKYSDLYGLKGWTYKNYKIITYPYIHFPVKRANYWFLYKLSKQAKKYMDQTGSFDLIHAHYLLPDGFIAYKIQKKYQIPYVLTIRSQDKQYLQKISKINPDYIKSKKIIRNAKKIIVTNAGLKEFMESYYHTNCRIVPHGIDIKNFNYNPEEDTKSEIIIITAANLIKRKNIDWVIKGVNEYSGSKQILLKIIGDGPELNYLRGLSEGKKNINFIGRISRDEVLKILSHSDIFVLPSFNETFGLVYLEAAASGNAMIGIKGEGVFGFFEEGSEIFFCENYTDFKEKLFTLIDNNQLRNELKKNAFLKAKKYEWEKITEIYISIYKKTIS